MAKSTAISTTPVRRSEAPVATSPNVAPKAELQQAKAMTEAMTEIQSAITIAKAMPRDYEEVQTELAKSMARPKMAEKAVYRRRQGYKTDPETNQRIKDAQGRDVPNIIEGPSVHLAREAARCMGNIRQGHNIIRDDENHRIIRAFAWDVQTNTKVEKDDLIEKTIERKYLAKDSIKVGERTNTSGQKVYIVRPSEDELRTLVNRRAAFAVRNAILELVPKDIIDDAQDAAKAALKLSAGVDLPGQRLKMVAAFAAEEFNVTSEMLERYCGKPVDEFTAEDIAALRLVYTSIKDNATTVANEFGEEKPAKPPRERATYTPKPAAESNRGHGADNIAAVAGTAIDATTGEIIEEAEYTQDPGLQFE